MTEQTRPQINGSGHTAYDTGDGFLVLRDVPIMADVPKGVKGAPEDVGPEWMGDAAKFAGERYAAGKYAAPLHIGHHDDAGLTHPEFAGFVRPSRVGKMTLDGKERPVLFSDWKVKKSAFKKIEGAELPYVSPEIRSWNKRQISSVALLDSAPPHFGFPMLTIKEVVSDPHASFSAELDGCKIAKFADGFERVTFDPTEDKKEKEIETKKLEGKPMADEVKPAQNEQSGKPDPSPKEQNPPGKAAVPQAAAVKMEQEARDAARFAAMEDANAALKKRLDERDAADKAKLLEAKALESMNGFQIGPKAKEQIAKFAQQGEEALNAFIETLKEVTPKDSPRSFAAAEAAMAVPVNDPALAKFAQQGPEKLEAAARFASEYRTLKAHGAGKGMTIKEEDYVKFQMDAMDNGDQTHWGINLGFGK